MNEKLDALLEQIDTIQKQKQESELHKDYHKKLIAMLEDIAELSKYTKQTLGTPYVLMPVKSFAGTVCIKSHFDLCQQNLLQEMI